MASPDVVSAAAGASGLTLPKAAGAALVLEAALLAGLALGLAHAKPTPQPDPPVMITLAQPPAPPPPPKPKVQPKPKPLAKPVHRPDPKPRPEQHHVAISQDPGPTPKVVAPPETVAPKPVAKPAPKAKGPDVPESFEDLLRQAVQDAVNYPFAAKLAHLTGRAQVSFDYRDGRASNIRILTSSGASVLDEAAKAAVAAAAYPPPPSNLAGQSLPCTVWVRFYLGGPGAN